MRVDLSSLLDVKDREGLHALLWEFRDVFQGLGKVECVLHKTRLQLDIMQRGHKQVNNHQQQKDDPHSSL